MNEESKSKKEDEIFFSDCGEPIKRNAVVCPHCGIQVKELETKSISNVSVKSKAVAVVLAIFFSHFLFYILMAEMRLNFGFIQ